MKYKWKFRGIWAYDWCENGLFDALDPPWLVRHKVDNNSYWRREGNQARYKWGEKKGTFYLYDSCITYLCDKHNILEEIVLDQEKIWGEDFRK